MAYNPTFEQIEYAARTVILDSALKVASVFDSTKLSKEVEKAYKIITYLKAIQNDTSLTFDEKNVIYQCIISTGNIFNFPVAPQLGSASVPDIILGGGGTTVIINQGANLPQGSNTDIDVASEIVDSFARINSEAGVWYYKVTSPLGAVRSGVVHAIWNTSQVDWFETSTPDLNGDTSGLTFTVTNDGTTIALVANVISNNWQVYFTRLPIFSN